MPRRKWEANTHALTVIEGLKGQPAAARWNEHQRRQAQYYPGRDQFLAHAPQALEVHEQRQREGCLVRKTARLKILVGELPRALQQSDARLG